jgi:hypothetical protein
VTDRAQTGLRDRPDRRDDRLGLLLPVVGAGIGLLITLLFVVHLSFFYAIAAIMPTILSEPFPISVRYTDVWMAFQLANVVCVGLRPAGHRRTGRPQRRLALLPTLLIVLVCLISLAGLRTTVREAKGIDLREV